MKTCRYHVCFFTHKKNIMRHILTLLIACMTSPAYSANYTEIKNQLMNEYGFEEVYFTTPDQLILNGLLRTRENAPFTVICASGFIPGRKEDNLPLVPLFPKDCNILLFDGRGHGISEGKFLSAITRYGPFESNDIIGAIEYCNTLFNNDIILFGRCSGAFHCAHALVALRHRATELKVKGAVLDSIWNSTKTAADNIYRGKYHDLLIKKLAWWYSTNDPKELTKTSAYQIMAYALKKIYDVMIWPLYQCNKTAEYVSMVHQKIHAISLPLLFIHAYNDYYIPIDEALLIASKVPHARTWWIEESKHSENHVVHKEEFQQRMNEFIADCLQDGK